MLLHKEHTFSKMNRLIRKIKKLKRVHLLVVVFVGVAVVTGLVIGGATLTKGNAAYSSVMPAQQATVTDSQQSGNDHTPATTTEETTVPGQPSAPTTSQTAQVPTPQSKTTQQSATLSDPTPDPVTVTSAEPVDLGNGNFDCAITFSDGTSKTREWKRHTDTSDTVKGGCSSIVGMLKSEV
jgi:hypothetical protein